MSLSQSRSRAAICAVLLFCVPALAQAIAVTSTSPLGNANNAIEYYKSKNEEVDIDITAYGPGLHMLRADTSPVADRIKRMKDMVFPGKIQFSACHNTMQNMEKAEGHPIKILSEATEVPSGAVHLSELQEQGWTYLKP